MTAKKLNKKAAIWETNINIGIGFFLSWAVTAILNSFDGFNLFGSFLVTCIFTVVSWSRSFAVRHYLGDKIKAFAVKMSS